ncbi:MAG: sensor histidine kinase [Bacteroidota bacterium]
MQNSLSIRRLLLHFTVIATIVSAVSVLMYLTRLEGITNKSLSYYIVQGLTGVMLFVLPPVYFNIYWLIPKFLVTKKYLIYGLLAVVTVIVWGIIIGTAEPWTDEHWFGDQSQSIDWSGGILAVALLMIISGFINLAYRWFIQSTKIKQLENDRLLMELSVLKNQINPHFFFNTLNNLYALSLEHSAQTPGVILKLSEMMRYAIYECKEPKVQLLHEIKYIENYLSLEKIRQDESCEVTFEHHISANDIFIAPMVLLVFIENAFKHGFGTLASHAYIHIKLHNDEESIYFVVKNNFGEVENNSEKGLGLDNVKRRLSLLYPGMHDLKIDRSHGEFMVQLALKYD